MNKDKTMVLLGLKKAEIRMLPDTDSSVFNLLLNAEIGMHLEGMLWIAKEQMDRHTPVMIAVNHRKSSNIFEGLKKIEVVIKLYGVASDKFLLKGEIQVITNGLRETRKYDVRTLPEVAFDYYKSIGVETTLEEQKYKWAECIEEDCRRKGLNFVEMCKNTSEFAESILKEK